MDESEELEQLLFEAIKEEALKDILRDEEKKIQQRRKIIKFFAVVIPVAAMLIAGLFLFKNYSMTDNQNKAAMLLAEITPLPASKGEDLSDITLQYNTIVEELKKENSDNKNEMIQKIDSLNTIMASDPNLSLLRCNLMYFKALCFLYNNDVDKTKSILEEIADNEEFWYHSKAIELLNDLSK